MAEAAAVGAAVGAVSGEVEAGEEGLEGRIAVDEGGDMRGSVLDDGAKREDEEGEQDERDEVGGERRSGFSEKLCSGTQVLQPWVVAHRASCDFRVLGISGFCAFFLSAFGFFGFFVCFVFLSFLGASLFGVRKGKEGGWLWCSV